MYIKLVVQFSYENLCNKIHKFWIHFVVQPIIYDYVIHLYTMMTFFGGNDDSWFLFVWHYFKSHYQFHLYHHMNLLFYMDLVYFCVTQLYILSIYDICHYNNDSFLFSSSDACWAVLTIATKMTQNFMKTQPHTKNTITKSQN